MKRDMDLIRAILLTIEAQPGGNAPDRLRIKGYSAEQVSYHVYLLIQAGLLEGHDIINVRSNSPEAAAHNLTWAGHEFLENARAPATWTEAKELMKRSASGSFQIWQSVLTSLAMRNLESEPQPGVPADAPALRAGVPSAASRPRRS